LDTLQLQLLDKDKKKAISHPVKYLKFIAALDNILTDVVGVFVTVDTSYEELIETFEKFESNLKKGYSIDYRRKDKHRKPNWKLGYAPLERPPGYQPIIANKGLIGHKQYTREEYSKSKLLKLIVSTTSLFTNRFPPPKKSLSSGINKILSITTIEKLAI